MNVIHQIGVSFYTIWKDIKLLCAVVFSHMFGSEVAG